MKKRPPFGKAFEPPPPGGVRVAIGPGAWRFAERHHCPIMVLPDDSSPSDFRWPGDGKPALIHERKTYDDQRLTAMARELLRAGASSVVAIREALVDHDPRKFFDLELLS